MTQASALLSGITCTYVIADKGYDSDATVELVVSQGSEPVIPPRKCRTRQRNYDKDVYKERHLVEVFFNRIKHFRKVATRYEKLARHYMAMVEIACILVWLV